MKEMKEINTKDNGMYTAAAVLVTAREKDVTFASAAVDFPETIANYKKQFEGIQDQQELANTIINTYNLDANSVERATEESVLTPKMANMLKSAIDR